MTPVGVIVPCLNEESVLRLTLESIALQGEAVELIVVDGGSTDRSRAIAQEYGRVIVAPRGRASQMNAGAAECRSEVLLFLHADTVLPAGALEAVRRKVSDPLVEAGTFRLRFDRPTPLLRLYSACTRLQLSLLCFGDRGLFVRRDVFADVGGFPDLPMFEDLELARTLRKRGGFVYVDEFVTTSARRFLAEGPLRQQLRNAYLWARYLMGTDPHRLAHLYPYQTG